MKKSGIADRYINKIGIYYKNEVDKYLANSNVGDTAKPN